MLHVLSIKLFCFLIYVLELNIVIYNVSGMEVSKSIMNGASAQLNIESLSNGVYFVKVSNENGFSKTVKFVK